MTKEKSTKRALVVGLGASGWAALAYLVRRGWTVTAADTREAPPNAERVRAEHPSVVLKLGPKSLDPALAEDIDLLVMSPGISPITGAAAPLAARARSLGVDVAGEIELFARELKRLKDESGYSPKIIGITGTNGKTTTTTLTAKMAAAAGKSVIAAGNIGPNAVTELLKAEDAGSLPQYWVLELSSFQLQTTSSLMCDSAAILNVTEDHIDWHGSMAMYFEAKKRIFGPHTVRVLNRDDAMSISCEAGAPALRTFGAGAPAHRGDFGLSDIDGLSWLSMIPALSDDDRARAKADKKFEPAGLPDAVPLMPESALQIQGRHNAMNALAAIALATSAGIPMDAALNALAHYKGEPHRVQKILTVDGVDFIDDSKGTNVGAVVAAVEGFAAQKRRLLIVLGGDGKGQDFAPLASALKGRAALAAVIGMDGEKIAKVLDAAQIPNVRTKTLEEAVEQLWAAHRPGDALLLSPACASWDMFRDYAHRSAVFVDCAKRIAEGLKPTQDR